MLEDEDKNIPEEKIESGGKLPYTMLIVLVLLVIAVLALIANAVQDFSEKVKAEKNSQPVRAFSNTKPQKRNTVTENVSRDNRFEHIKQNTTEPVTIAINPLECYNGNTKAEMYDIRKSYVKKSIFATPDYQPREEVFGSIQDGKPWWHIDACSRPDVDNTYGVSSLSRFINNPSLLLPVYFSFSLKYHDDYKEYCNGNFSKTIPDAASYNPSENMITVKYPMSKYVTNHRLNHYYGQKNILYPLILSGLNARDFGYDYIYINNRNNIDMVSSSSNASQHVYKLLDYIHVGSSCKHPQGCNNHSPYQSEIEFVITSLPADMTIKLWKKEPITKELPADINYKIVFEEE